MFVFLTIKAYTQNLYKQTNRTTVVLPEFFWEITVECNDFNFNLYKQRKKTRSLNKLVLKMFSENWYAFLHWQRQRYLQCKNKLYGTSVIGLSVHVIVLWYLLSLLYYEEYEFHFSNNQHNTCFTRALNIKAPGDDQIKSSNPYMFVYVVGFDWWKSRNFDFFAFDEFLFDRLQFGLTSIISFASISS